jgi:hypothetical protein
MANQSEIVVHLLEHNKELRVENKELQNEVKTVLREKEVVMREKEVVMREKEVVIEDKHARDLEVLRLQQQLKVDADLNMQLRNARNIRGALECAATRIQTGSGTDTALKQLRKLPEYATTFKHKLDFILQKHNLRERDVLQCIDNLYLYSFSKAMHGSERHVYIRQEEMAPTECAALALVFEVTCIEYVVINEQGDELLESPYKCSCLTSSRYQQESTGSSVPSSSTAGDHTVGSREGSSSNKASSDQGGGRARGSSKAGRPVTRQHTRGTGGGRGSQRKLQAHM